MQLSKNFTLSELTYSVTAEANKIYNKPSAQVIENLRQLCVHILQPLRDHFKTPVIISSGYRSSALNKKIGGVANSQHLTGNAADIIMPAQKLTAVFDYINKNLPFDQLLLEHNRSGYKWIHVSYNPKNNRKIAIDNYAA